MPNFIQICSYIIKKILDNRQKTSELRHSTSSGYTETNQVKNLSLSICSVSCAYTFLYFHNKITGYNATTMVVYFCSLTYVCFVYILHGPVALKQYHLFVCLFVIILQKSLWFNNVYWQKSQKYYCTSEA